MEAHGDLAMGNYKPGHQNGLLHTLIRSNCKHYIFQDDENRGTSSHPYSYFYKTSKLIWMRDSPLLLLYCELCRTDLSPH
jgi:hypothetical protein